MFGVAIAVYRTEAQVLSRISLTSTHTEMPRIGLIRGMGAIGDRVARMASLERPPRDAGG